MDPFGAYSKYYKLLYQDKDYSGEVDYVHNIIKKFRPDAKQILDLGCGAGDHALLLAQKGYTIYGVDASEGMLSQTPQNLSNDNPHFIHGDIRNIRLPKKFEVVISLFHVISYQISNEDLFNSFLTAYHHLDKNGIFIFDCWYGPAVLTVHPEVRVKCCQDESLSLIRVAEPLIHLNENFVDVNYNIWIHDLTNDKIEEIKEQHKLRYLFKPETEFFLQQAGFTIKGFYEYLTFKEPQNHSWSVCFIGQK